MLRIVSASNVPNFHQVQMGLDGQASKAFDAIKNVILHKTLLSHPDFTNIFDIHTEASYLQLGAVIS